MSKQAKVKRKIKEARGVAIERRQASLEVYDAPVPRNAYEREPVYAPTGGESLTEQHHARSCDINTIMARYQQTGIIDHMKHYEPVYGDISDVDFKRAMDTVARVKTEFHDLPAYIREHFNQDENAYLQAVSTEEGIQELRDIPHPAQTYEDDGAPAGTSDAEPHIVGRTETPPAQPQEPAASPEN